MCVVLPVYGGAWDADQAFEACSPQLVVPAFQSTGSRFQQLWGTSHIAVAAGPRLRYKIGCVGYGGGWWCLSMQQLGSILLGGLLMSFVCYGDLTFRLHGMVIWGMISKLALSLVLGHEESLVIIQPLRLHAHGFDLDKLGTLTTSSFSHLVIACSVAPTSCLPFTLSGFR